jgi:hypothetical protein
VGFDEGIEKKEGFIYTKRNQISRQSQDREGMLVSWLVHAKLSLSDHYTCGLDKR